MIVRIIAILLSSLIFMVGLLVFLRNTKKVENRVFLGIAIFSALWGYTYQNIEYFSDIKFVEAFNAAAYLFGLLLMFMVTYFTYEFPVKRDKKVLLFYCLVLIPTAILSLTPLIAGGVTKLPNEEFSYEFSSGPLSLVYIAVMMVGVLQIAKNLFFERKNFNAEQKGQARTAAWGFILSFVAGVGLSVAIPVIIPGTKLDDFAPFSLIFLICFTALAITKHKLFDIKLIVARSLGYVLSLGLVGVVASLLLFGFSAQLESLGVSQGIQRAFFVVTTIALAITYLPMKRFFDKITRKFFYRDAYETQDLLNEFNEAIVSTIELDKLLRRASAVIEGYIKPEFCSFALINAGDQTIRIIGDTANKLSQEMIEQSRAYMKDFKQKIYMTDLIEEAVDLKSLLQQSNIGAIIRVSKTNTQEGLGYMLVGYKKSGNLYNTQDTDALEILANELAIAIENALQYEEIQNFAKTLEGKVDEATKNLRRANEKLKKLDETKDDFISMASHQLRTPLTSVKGYVSMVLEGDAGKVSSKQKELLDQAFVSSQRMVYLIADLLNVSRLRTGKFIIEAKPTNLADVVEGEISQLTETAKGRGLNLAFAKPAHFPALMLDETKIRQVIMNFADNAIYYTPSGGHIKVGLEDKGETIEFTVTDDGIGVPKSEQHHLFGKFYRAGNAKKARPDGTGLGLFMAKKVVVAQGGAIIFKTQEGKGSTFGFSFEKKPILPENYKGAVAAPPAGEAPVEAETTPDKPAKTPTETPTEPPTETPAKK